MSLLRLEAQLETHRHLVTLAVVRVAALRTERPKQDYEVRIAMLKQQLSNKEKAHDAEVDELKEKLALLQRQLSVKAPPKRRLVSPPSSAGLVATLFAPLTPFAPLVGPVFRSKRPDKDKPRIEPPVRAMAEGTPSDEELENGKRRRKVQLSTATKRVKLGQSKGLHVEDEELNTLSYYQDTNVLMDSSSPMRPQAEPMEPVKKRHVFKID